MLYLSLVWLTYTNIVQSVYIFNNENFNLRFLQIANPRGHFYIFKIFSMLLLKITKFSQEVQNIFVDAMSVKKNSKLYFFGFLMQKTQFFRFYRLKMFFENFNTHCILTLINNTLVLGSLFFFEVIRRYLKISVKY